MNGTCYALNAAKYASGVVYSPNASGKHFLYSPYGFTAYETAAISLLTSSSDF